jgi:hypothetical protein
VSLPSCGQHHCHQDYDEDDFYNIDDFVEILIRCRFCFILTLFEIYFIVCFFWDLFTLYQMNIYFETRRWMFIYVNLEWSYIIMNRFWYVFVMKNKLCDMLIISEIKQTYVNNLDILYTVKLCVSYRWLISQVKLFQQTRTL